MSRIFDTRMLAAATLAALLVLLAVDRSKMLAFSTIGSSWSGAGAVYRVNPSFVDPTAGTPTQQVAAIQAAAGEWGNAGGADFQFQYAGTTTNSSLATNGSNDVFYSHTDGNGVLAVTFWWTSGGSLTEFDIEFYDRGGAFDFTWALSPAWNEFDIQSVACHEFGHALGLGHSTVNGSTMYPSLAAGTLTARTLEPDDIAGIQSIYGPAPGANPGITNIVPSSGWVGGGYTVTIQGADFGAGVAVAFGNQSATQVTVIAPGILICTVPPGSGQGPVDVVVVGGNSSGFLAGGFNYDTCRSLSGPVLSAGWNDFECMAPADQGKFFRGVVSTVADSIPMSNFDPTDPRVFPLGWSDVFYYSLNAGTIPLPYWQNTSGFLDASGRAVFKLWGIDAPQVSGLQLHLCFYAVDANAPSGLSTISNRVTVAMP